MLERVAGNAAQWSVEDWRLIGIMVDAKSSPDDRVYCEPMRAGDEVNVIWRGLAVNLFKDGGESYWYNLMSEAPRLFVVLEHSGDHADDNYPAPLPRIVTASQDEALAHMETDAAVHSIGMPGAMIDRLERFVVNHYVPEKKKKRKRQAWYQQQ
jgi:hypothetical protein